MSNINIRKRAGHTEPLDITKIRKMTTESTDGLEGVSQSELELDAQIKFIDGMSSSDIQDALIKTAVEKIDIDVPNWTFVGARLFLYDLYHKVGRIIGGEKGKPYSHLRTYLEYGIKLNRITPTFVFEKDSDGNLVELFDLDQLSDYIKPERDLQFNYLGIKAAYDKYLIKDHQGNPIELPQQMFMAIAMFLAQHEETLELKMERAKEFYDTISTFDVMLATPTLSGARKNRNQLASCYIGASGDNIEGIFDAYKEMALLSKHGGGIGWDWHDIRCMGGVIDDNYAAAGGVVPFLKINNDVALAVDQLGVRKGSIAVYLEPWHIDIEDFIDVKKNSGEDRRRAHDLFPALWIPDLFMQRVLEDGNWTLFDPYETKDLHNLTEDDFDKRYVHYEHDESIRKISIRAKDLWKKILTSYFESGSPFLCWKDNANRANPNKHVGKIRSSNLCFTGDTMVATAYGQNAISIKSLAEYSNGINKFPVYCAEETTTKVTHTRKTIGKKGGGHTTAKVWKDQIKNAVAFKTGTQKVITVKLANGDEFRCTPEHQLALFNGGYIQAKYSLGKELQSIYTFTNIGPGTKYRYINSLTNPSQKQARMIWEFYNNTKIPNGYHLDHIDNNNKNDVITNLQLLTKDEHWEKTKVERKGDGNTVHRKSTKEDELIKSLNKSLEVKGNNNPKYNGISNYEFITILKVFNRLIPGEFNRRKYLYIRENFNLEFALPEFLSKYRFNSDFGLLCDYVNEVQTYNGEYEQNPERDYIERIDFNKDRINYIQHYFQQPFKTNDDDLHYNIRNSGLRVVDIIDNGEVEDVYDLTVEDNHNFYILTSGDENYENSNGVLVHNCTEIFQNTGPDTYLLKIYNEFQEIDGTISSSDESYIMVDELTVALLSNGFEKQAKYLNTMDTIIGFKSSDDLSNENQEFEYLEEPFKIYSIEKQRLPGKTAVCNLASINISKVNTKEDFERVIPTAVRMLDKVIDLNFYPLKKVKDTNLLSRAIGLGAMGEAQYLAENQIMFGTQEHFNKINYLYECISYNTIKASSELGKEKGNYPDFVGSDWSKGIMPHDHANYHVAELLTKEVAAYSQSEWNALRDAASKNMRNGYLMAIAPTSSISILVGTTQAIEPCYKRKWYEEGLSGLIPVTVPNLNPNTWQYYIPAFEVNQLDIVRAAAIRQKWIDQGQSTNIFMSLDKASGKYLHEIYMLAWKLGCKSTYYLRSQSPDAKKAEMDVVDRSIECTSCQ